MSRAVLAWLALCGSLAAPRPARGEGTAGTERGRGSGSRRSSRKVGVQVRGGTGEVAFSRMSLSRLSFSLYG